MKLLALPPTALTWTAVIAQALWIASLDIPRPDFHRHELARAQLLRAMRST